MTIKLSSVENNSQPTNQKDNEIYETISKFLQLFICCFCLMAYQCIMGHLMLKFYTCVNVWL